MKYHPRPVTRIQRDPALDRPGIRSRDSLRRFDLERQMPASHFNKAVHFQTIVRAHVE